ncbi:COY1 (YKL179C) [Zygosaccharomyces parabailii]|nr:COY1 (YKL179C) [Zygosaccharomyces parabailii]CDH08361.1 probable protein CASP [Zygosaccharomyces bailii ISA1307]
MDSSIYSHAFELWSKADLAGLQKQLDEDVIEVKEKETRSLDSRKKLAAETKRFKKLDSGEKLGNVNKIIKQYQQEIDNLTQRSKFSEMILLNVYAKLAEAPDPKPLLQHSLEKLTKVDDSKELKEKLEVLEDKLAKYADYDTLKTRLLDLEQNSAVTMAKRLTSKEQEINSTWNEKQRNWNQREQELTKQLNSLTSSNKALEAKISKQIEFGGEENSSRDQQESKNYTNSSGYNLLAQELELSHSRVLQLEKRNEELNGLLAKATSSAEQESQLQSKETKIKQMESENALLSASLERERNSHSKLNVELNEQLQSLKAEKSYYQSEVKAIRMKLENYADYNKLKEELSALRRIEFGADDESGDTGSESNGHDNVESSLLSANKKLQANLADMRVKCANYEEKVTSLENAVAELENKVGELEKLNNKLELDLQNFEDAEEAFNDTSSMISGITRQVRSRGGPSGNGRYSPTTSIVGIPEEGELGSTSSNNTILPIVTKQRDRFRNRNVELEKQLRQNAVERTRLKSEISKLKTDNGKLYERIRYVTSYGHTGNDATSTAAATLVDAEAQYSRTYEDSLNPLNNFKKREMEYYRKNRLSVWEKLFSSFAKVILANKSTRMAFLLYCIGTHALVFMMSIYVINLNGYMKPEVGVIQPSTQAAPANIAANGGAVGPPGLANAPGVDAARAGAAGVGGAGMINGVQI